MPELGEQLRNLIDADVRPVTAGEAQRIASWRSRESSRTGTRRRWLVTVGAAVMALSIGIGVFAAQDESSRRDINTSPGRNDTVNAALPGSIVAEKGGDLVELSSSGALVRVIAKRGFISAGGGLSVRADGTEVLVDAMTGRQCPRRTADPGVGLGRLDLQTGRTRVVDLSPQVRAVAVAIWSLDGGRFAYGSYRCDGSTELVVRNVGGAERRITAPSYTFGPVPIGWSGDGRHVLVLMQGRARDDEWWYVDASKSGRLKDRGVRVPGTANVGAFDLLPLGASGRWVAIVGDPRAGNVPKVVQFDIATGEVKRTLFRWESLPPNVGLRLVDSDVSGHHILLRTFVEGDAGSTLYRWSVGELQPTAIGSGLGAAAWLDTTAQTAGLRPVQEVAVLVLDGSGIPGSAVATANMLRGLGYPIAKTGDAALQRGTTVHCRAGYEDKAAALAEAVKSMARGRVVSVAPFLDPAPPGSEIANCVVVLGQWP